MSEDEWVRVAMDDDKLVVDILLNLHQPPPVGPPQPPLPQKPAALSLSWSVRQRRSSSHNNNELSAKTKRAEAAPKDPARASPSTPLSWSGGSDGAEESSGLHVVRSKVALASKTPSTGKRSRKKKTLAELKEEEHLLLEERRNLTSQLEALRLVVEKERAKYEGLKRIKLDLIPSKDVTSAVRPEQVHLEQSHKIQEECSISPICDGSNKLEQSLTHTSSNNEDCSFLLPDLNLPVDDDSGSDILYGTS